MGTARSATVCAALVASATLLIAGLPSAAAAPAAKPGTRVVIRSSLDKKIGVPDISGTFTASGGISDRGTFAGTALPVYGKVHGHVVVVAYDFIQTQKGTLGSFVTKCRDTHFVLDKHGNVKRTTGRCAITGATGAYARLQPVGPTTSLASYPRKDYIHIVRFVRVRIRSA